MANQLKKLQEEQHNLQVNQSRIKTIMRQNSTDPRPKTIMNTNRPKMVVLKPMEKKDKEKEKGKEE